MINRYSDVETGVVSALSDGGWVHVRAQAYDLPDRAVTQLKIDVADMVAPLRRFRVEISSTVFRAAGARAFLDPFRDVATIVMNERDARRWSYVDP